MINSPEKIYIFFEKTDKAGESLFTGDKYKRVGDVEYIRADIAKEKCITKEEAKEREAKLIKEVYTRAILIVQGEEESELAMAELEDDNTIIAGIYREAGLEELK